MLYQRQAYINDYCTQWSDSLAEGLRAEPNLHFLPSANLEKLRLSCIQHLKQPLSIGTRRKPIINLDAAMDGFTQCPSHDYVCSGSVVIGHEQTIAIHRQAALR